MSNDDGGPGERRPEPVYRVIRLVATSMESWEQAARNGVREAAKTVSGLDHARVVEMDTVVRDGRAAQFRVKLELGFQVDRTRPGPEPGAPSVVVRRTLIVANETLAGDRIPGLVADRMAAGPCEFHILVPATRSRETRRLTAVTGDPLSGYAVVDTVGLDQAIARDRAEAQERLDTFTARLAALGADFTSEIGAADPALAIAQVMERASFDDIVISTLPSSVSRWLRIDLPSRVRRSYAIPVTTFTVEG
ncbi:MAG: dodecin family protein [Actinomycetota bacterium]